VVSLTNGSQRNILRSEILGPLKPDLLPDYAKLQLSQISPREWTPRSEQRYCGYCFLEDGRYASGVWLSSAEDALAYIKMQIPYQHRLMLCDALDVAVLEIVDGRMVHSAPPELQL
jgi:hypothetical protein